MIRTTAVAALVFAVATSALAFDASNFKDFSSIAPASSSWQNQSGSTMIIQVDSFGNVSGQYVNRAQGTGCQNSPYPLTGRVNGTFIAFSVGWNNSTENCNSATGWTGYAQVNGNNTEIVTSWNLAYEGGSGPAIEQGQDTFQYVPTTENKSLLKD
ncbi:avidin/streptavidin family protein [Rhizobium sp. CCGE 510]|uniref:avidin/streptavidin family protein n=1 Tax=Rhizobium sp. CCGE 510 TaxID=1132836 RepID=UPI00027B8759|nr:avidin/streptavidin family protein [Rhizobium sp. CCGE 510]EJT01362.1 hypothetical protein RCCGE510_28956 [Rhizobium sp. CCGE 510]